VEASGASRQGEERLVRVRTLARSLTHAPARAWCAGGPHTFKADSPTYVKPSKPTSACVWCDKRTKSVLRCRSTRVCYLSPRRTVLIALPSTTESIAASCVKHVSIWLMSSAERTGGWNTGYKRRSRV